MTEAEKLQAFRAECIGWLGELVSLTVKLENVSDLQEYSAGLVSLLEGFEGRDVFPYYRKRQKIAHKREEHAGGSSN